MEEAASPRRKGRLVLKIVPWFNKLELETVYAKLYSEDPIDQRWGVDRVSAWIARCSSATVPLGVEATEAFIRAKIQDYTVQNNISISSFSDVSLMYCMALVRFVTLVTEQSQFSAYNIPMSDIARKHGIPDWVVNLRHQATHSSTPPLRKLRSASDACLGWLKEHFWEIELQNCHEYCTPVNNVEDTCRKALSQFQRVQCESLFFTENSAKKRGTKPSHKQVMSDITKLAKQHGKHLVYTLAKPEFILSLTACSKPLVEISDRFIEEEAVALPKSLEKFWMPVISVLNQKNLLGTLVICLLNVLKELDDQKQRLAVSWVWAILDASAVSWGSSNQESCFAKALKHATPVMNWLALLEACLHSCSKYMPAILPVIIDHVYPPIPKEKINSIMGLVAIFTGALAELHDGDVSEDQRIYNIDNVKTVFELHDVVGEGETSLYHSKSPWKLCTDDLEWQGYPIGHIFGLENKDVDPRALEMDHLSGTKSEDKNAAPSEPSVVKMDCDENKSLNENPEVPIDEEKIEDVEMDESSAGLCRADYCDPDDVTVF